MSDKDTKIYHKRMAKLEAWNIVLEDIKNYADRLDERDCIDLYLVTNILRRHLEDILNHGA